MDTKSVPVITIQTSTAPTVKPLPTMTHLKSKKKKTLPSRMMATPSLTMRTTNPMVVTRKTTSLMKAMKVTASLMITKMITPNLMEMTRMTLNLTVEMTKMTPNPTVEMKINPNLMMEMTKMTHNLMMTTLSQTIIRTTLIMMLTHSKNSLI